MAVRFASVDALPPHHRAQAQQQMASVRTHRPEVGREAPRAPKPAPRTRRPRRDEEHNEQVVFFNRIRTLAMNDARYAQAVDRTFAIPNGGGRSKREAGRLKAEGVRAGVSDIFCALPGDGHHGLWIEMKSLEGYASREQAAWIADGERLGYAGAVCRGADAAMKVWREYVDSALGVWEGSW